MTTAGSTVEVTTLGTTVPAVRIIAVFHYFN